MNKNPYILIFLILSVNLTKSMEHEEIAPADKVLQTIKRSLQNKFITCYEILGVDYQASQAEIRTAYRTLARKFHPDRYPNADVFPKIREAYEILSDDQKRRCYNDYLRYVLIIINKEVSVDHSKALEMAKQGYETTKNSIIKNQFTTFYRMLGVSYYASGQEIQRAYYKVKQHTLNPANIDLQGFEMTNTILELIKHASVILSDPLERKMYNENLNQLSITKIN